MPEIKLDTPDIGERFWSTIERERVTFENSQNNGRKPLLEAEPETEE
jgi:hypothetical protein